jgi:MYXO-CTERM domain-containing protein
MKYRPWALCSMLVAASSPAWADLYPPPGYPPPEQVACDSKDSGDPCSIDVPSIVDCPSSRECACSAISCLTYFFYSVCGDAGDDASMDAGERGEGGCLLVDAGTTPLYYNCLLCLPPPSPIRDGSLCGVDDVCEVDGSPFDATIGDAFGTADGPEVVISPGEAAPSGDATVPYDATTANDASAAADGAVPNDVITAGDAGVTPNDGTAPADSTTTNEAAAAYDATLGADGGAEENAGTAGGSEGCGCSTESVREGRGYYPWLLAALMTLGLRRRRPPQ